MIRSYDLWTKWRCFGSATMSVVLETRESLLNPSFTLRLLVDVFEHLERILRTVLRLNVVKHRVSVEVTEAEHLVVVLAAVCIRLNDDILALDLPDVRV